MRRVEAVVVGGGPAGSTCAWQLRRAGVGVVVLDRARFPRLKLCAGWITPEVVADLELDPRAYPHRFLTFERLHVHYRRFGLAIGCTQHSIRRVEFDAWLLERSGAEVVQHTVREVRREGEEFVIDGRWRCRWLVGAGGTRCPVYRQLFREEVPRDERVQTVTFEHEFAYPWDRGDCHLWFFERGLPGYSWYVPKQHGWLNIGVGAMAAKLKRRGEDIRTHWQHLLARLRRDGLLDARALEPAGYSYYLRGAAAVTRRGNAFVIGDAAGLATRDLCEGIGPAVRSAKRAAQSIVDGGACDLDGVTGRSIAFGPASRLLERAFAGAT